MKKLILLSVLIFSLSFLYAQKGKVNSANSLINPAEGGYGQVDKAKEAIDEAIKDESVIDWPKTWYVRGMVYQKIHEDPTGFYKDLDSLALVKAFKSYKKALKLGKKEYDAYVAERNEKGKKIRKDLEDFGYREEIMEKLYVDKQTPGIRNDFVNLSVQNINDNDWSSALKSLEYIFEIDSIINFPYKDSVFYYYAAIAAHNQKKYEKALKYYKITRDLNYAGVEPYNNTISVYYALGDTAKALELMKEGINKFPENNEALLGSLVNYYINSGKEDEALKFIDQALQKKNPHPSFFFTKGAIHDQLNEFDKAMQAYDDAIKIDPEYADAYYNKGISFVKQANIHFQKATNMPLDKSNEAEAEKAKGNEILKKAYPLMEKAHALKPDEKLFLLGLKEVYVKLNMKDKLKEVDEKIDALKE